MEMELFNHKKHIQFDVHAHLQYINSGDFNGDNILDLVIIDSINDRIHILRGYGNGSFAIVTTYDGISDSYPIWLNVVDLNYNNPI